MFAGLKRKHPGSSVRHLLFYELCRRISVLALRVLYRPIVLNRERVPSEGSLILVANHQSYFDPPFIGGLADQRHYDFIAKGGLFSNPSFGRMLAALNSIPITENTGDRQAIQEALRRLGEDKAVLLFPEGSRSEDGTIGEFKRGAALMLKRAKCPIVPVAIEGVYDAFPRTRKLPRLFGARIAVWYGEPIQPGADLGRRGPLDELRAIIDTERLKLRAELRRGTGGKFPPPGPGDAPSTSSERPVEEAEPAAQS
ncbi:MAG: lysophospholipid acyltransferase family protein [Planctomycetota bacterium]